MSDETVDEAELAALEADETLVEGVTPNIRTNRKAFRALQHRNYRLFFFGQLISLVGTWMQSVALGWLVYRLTDSAFLLGLVGFSSQIPTFILASIAGVLAEI